MKKLFILNLLRQIQTNSHLKKKIFIGLGIFAFTGFLILGGIVWVGYNSVQYIMAQTKSFDLNTNYFKQIQSQSCQTEVTKLVNLSHLLNNPPAQIFNHLKTACTDSKINFNKIESNESETI